MTSISDHWIAHPRGRLFARRWEPASMRGAASPIVMFHDSLGSVALWRDLPAQLAEATGRCVIAYDRLGFGQSDARADPLPSTFIADEAASFLPAVLAHFEVDAFVAMGHSVGGGMAVETAARFPSRCERLVTIAAQTFAEPHTLDGVRVAQAQFQDPGQVARVAKYHGAKARWVLDAWIGTWLSPAFADWSLVDVLRRVRCPMLALHGDQDEYGSVRHPELIGLHVPSATVKVLAGRGHTPHRERPAEIVGLVAAFLG